MRAYVLTSQPLALPIDASTTVSSALPDRAVLDEAVRLSSWYLSVEGLEGLAHGLRFETSQAGLSGALTLTQALSSCLLTAPPDALVLFESGPVLHAREGFLEQAVDAAPDDPPVFLWVAFEIVEHEDGTRSLYTHGAPALGAPLEIEVDRSRRSAEELLERAADALLVALSEGNEVADGDTLELSEDTVRVRIQPSLRNTGDRTWRLRIP
jgi:hypothetical protein